MPWHDDANKRKAGGDEAEKQFAATVVCYCGGSFDFIGDRQKGFPDFTCDNCGQLVDVKSSPIAERTGNLSVSAIPWRNYPPDMLLVTRIKGEWIGEYKKNIQVANEKPFDPTHNTRGSHLGNTQFHLIPWRRFKRLTDFRMQVR